MHPRGLLGRQIASPTWIWSGHVRVGIGATCSGCRLPALGASRGHIPPHPLCLLAFASCMYIHEAKFCPLWAWLCCPVGPCFVFRLVLGRMPIGATARFGPCLVCSHGAFALLPAGALLCSWLVLSQMPAGAIARFRPCIVCSHGAHALLPAGALPCFLARFESNARWGDCPFRALFCCPLGPCVCFWLTKQWSRNRLATREPFKERAQATQKGAAVCISDLESSLSLQQTSIWHDPRVNKIFIVFTIK